MRTWNPGIKNRQGETTMSHKTLDEYLKPQQTQTIEKQPQPQQKQEEPKYKIIGFYRETQFQETSIGKIPKEWKVVKLVDICELVRGSEPGSSKYNVEGIGYKFIRVSTLSKQILEQVFVDEEPGKLVFCDKDDILMSFDGMPGVVRKGVEGAISSGIRVIKPKISNIDKDFLFYALQCKFVQKIIEMYTTGTTIKHASKSIPHISIPLPPLEEQKKIAEILTTVDKAIQKTDKIIEKTKRLKKGLMQELLTKGIGHKEFQETPIGKIPKTWQIVSIGDVCEQRSEIVQPSVNNKEPFVGLEHILSGETRLHNYAQRADVKSAKFRFYAGDILYGKLRPYLDKAVLTDFKGICSTDLLVLTPKGNVLKEFLIYILHSDNFIKHAIATTTGTNHPRTSWSAISKFKFGLPDLSEQQKIVEILSTVDKSLEVERKRKEKLERIKKALMDLFLTGKIRVKVS